MQHDRRIRHLWRVRARTPGLGAGRLVADGCPANGPCPGGLLPPGLASPPRRPLVARHRSCSLDECPSELDPAMRSLFRRLATGSGRALMTLVIVAVAIVAGRSLWVYYEESPWTRDGRIRADVVTIAPDVSGLVSEVLVHDN